MLSLQCFMLFSRLATESWKVGPLASRICVRWASKKQGGSTSNGRDSCPKFLGLKASGGEVRLRPLFGRARAASAATAHAGAPPRAVAAPSSAAAAAAAAAVSLRRLAAAAR